MAKRFKLGQDAKLYVTTELFDDNTHDDVDVTADNEWKNVKDVTIALSAKDIETNTRETAATGWTSSMSGLKDGTIKVKGLWKTTDEQFTAIKDAWVAGDEIGIVALTGAFDDATSQGPAGNFTVTDFERGEVIDEAISVDVTLKPSSEMQWYEVSGS